MRISRPCYDKAHRCPGWAGGGWHFAAITLCEWGHITWETPWSLGHCDKCDVRVLPRWVRWLEPRTWRHAVHR